MTTRLASTRTSSDMLFKILTGIAIVGAINWGLIGIFNWNLVDAIFGGGVREETSSASRVIYALVGLCGLVALPLLLSRQARHLPETRSV